MTIVPYGHSPVAKWPIKFSGLDRKEESKSIDNANVFIEHRVNNAEIVIDTFGSNDTPNSRASTPLENPYHRYDYVRMANSVEPATEEPDLKLDEIEILAAHRISAKMQRAKFGTSHEKILPAIARIKCWNCEANGHGLQQCPKPKTRLICYGCGEKAKRLHFTHVQTAAVKSIKTSTLSQLQISSKQITEMRINSTQHTS